MQCPENKATTLITAVEYVKILAGMEAKKRHKNNMLRMEYQRLQGAVWFNGRSVCVVRVLHDMIIDACMHVWSCLRIRDTVSGSSTATIAEAFWRRRDRELWLRQNGYER